jgi:alkylation response protein AidB-like acyl-CoA dehydrogenase
MPNFYSDNDDWLFYVNQYIDWKELVELVELNFTAKEAPKTWDEALESYREILELVGEFVANEVAPRARQIDAQGMQLKDGVVEGGEAHQAIFAQLDEMGMYGLSVPRELGGMNLPVLVYFIVNELFARGDVSRTRAGEGGVGLGLSLVKAIAVAHGGSVRLESAPGDTTVSVQLPGLAEATAD